MSVSTLTIILVVAYLLIVKIVGYFASRSKSKTIEDYFITGRNTGTIALIGTILATGVNGLAITVTPSLIYEGGILFSQMLVVVSAVAFFRWYFGPRVWTVCQKHNFITQAELFGHHYKSPMLYGLIVVITIFSVFPFLIVQFAAVAKIFSAATDNLITYEFAVLLLAVSTGIYIFLGGARAVIWTDVVQGIFFFIIFMVTAYLFTSWAGGYSEGVNKLTQVIPEKLTFNSENTPILIDRILSWSFGFFLFPHAFQRLMMGRSAKVVRQAAWQAFVVGLPIIFAIMIIGIMATATLYGQIDDRDQLVAEMYSRYFPLGGAMIVLAVFACGMSTIDSILLSLSSIFTRDVVQKVIPRPLSEKAQYQLAKAISVIMIVVVTALAISDIGRGYLAPLVTFGATFAAFLLWPLLGMFLWKKSTKAGVMSAMFLSFLTFVLLHFFGNFLVLPIPIGKATIVFFVGLFSFIIVSLLTQQAMKK